MLRSNRTPVLLVLLLLVLLGGVLFARTTFFATDTVMPPPPDAKYRDESLPIEERVADLLSYMTLEEKIGQMALVEKNSVRAPEDIATYHLGALLSGSGAKPQENTVAGWRDMIAGYQSVAAASRLGIPLLYGSDAIHGHAHVPGATVFPHAIGLGAAGNPQLVEEVARATALELAVTGVNWNYAPNLDLPQDMRWGRVYEAFSDDPALAAELGAAYVVGSHVGGPGQEALQVLATPKHFIGLGAMGWNTSLNKNFKIDQGVTQPDETLLRSVYLPPFAAAIDAGALSIMVGLNSWGSERTVVQKALVTDVLKQELGYQGFVVSDWYGVYEGRRSRFVAMVQAVNAGVDMVMLPFDYQTFTRHMIWAYRLGLISGERIDDAVGRILYAKFALGLFDEKAEVAEAQVGSPAHRALARTAVAQSLVLLKNEGNVLPLSPSVPHIRIAGSAADNIGRQMGAWTIEWQGIDGNWLSGATSILQGIEARVSDATTVEYDVLGNFAPGKKAPLGIAVVGEKPYAEGWGDTEYPVLSNEDLAAIKNLQASAERVVVVLVSGRPLLIENEIDSIDALVAAWLPGSEGAGVADVLFGDKQFVGTLPLPWPLRAEQLPITTEGETADGTPVLFPRYYGLQTNL